MTGAGAVASFTKIAEVDTAITPTIRAANGRNRGDVPTCFPPIFYKSKSFQHFNMKGRKGECEICRRKFTNSEGTL